MRYIELVLTLIRTVRRDLPNGARLAQDSSASCERPRVGCVARNVAIGRKVRLRGSPRERPESEGKPAFHCRREIGSTTLVRRSLYAQRWTALDFGSAAGSRLQNAQCRSATRNSCSMRAPLALVRVEMIFKVTLQFVRWPFRQLIQVGGSLAGPSYAFANPASGKVKLIGLPFSKAWIARLRPFLASRSNRRRLCNPACNHSGAGKRHMAQSPPHSRQ